MLLTAILVSGYTCFSVDWLEPLYILDNYPCIRLHLFQPRLFRALVTSVQRKFGEVILVSGKACFNLGWVGLLLTTVLVSGQTCFNVGWIGLLYPLDHYSGIWLDLLQPRLGRVTLCSGPLSLYLDTYVLAQVVQDYYLHMITTLVSGYTCFRVGWVGSFYTLTTILISGLTRSGFNQGWVQLPYTEYLLHITKVLALPITFDFPRQDNIKSTSGIFYVLQFGNLVVV